MYFLEIKTLEGGSCLGTHVRIKDFKIKKKKQTMLYFSLHRSFFTPTTLKKNKLQVRETIIVLKSLACQVAFHPLSSGKTYGIAPSSF